MSLEEIKEGKQKRLQMALNLMYITTDMGDGYATEIESLLKHTGLYKNNDKQAIKRIKELTSGMIRSIDNILSSDEEKENFGHDSDFLREVIELSAHTKTEEQELQVLSALKMIVKQ